MKLLFCFLAFGIAHAQDASRGEYLSRAASCRECHTIPGGADFAGGAAINTAFGKFFPPNITPDNQTGIGTWTAEDFQRALRLGRDPQHNFLYPTFPYRSFTKMTDADLQSLYEYLRSVTPVRRVNRPHDIEVPFGQRWLLRYWQLFFFRSPGKNPIKNIRVAVGPFKPDPNKSEQWNRGAYLVEAVLHCTECHTPRNLLGGPERADWMAGSNLVFSGRMPPNITPDPETGITWAWDEWLNFLSSGVDPKGKTPGVEMALAVRAASGLTLADRAAVVDYLMSLPPVRRVNEEPNDLHQVTEYRRNSRCPRVCPFGAA